MESFIVDSITEHANINNLIPTQQHGFRRGRSVESNLLTCLNDWISHVDNSQSVDVVYLDFCRAFDRVSIRLLLEKLDYFGICGNLHDWIGDFLSNRTFRVKVGDAYGDEKDVISGVPQGSVLGSYLCTLYTADIPTKILSKCAMYADDTKLYNASVNNKILQTDLDNLSR